MRTAGTMLVVVTALFAIVSAEAVSAAADAQRAELLLQKAGIEGGVACLPDCGSGDLALELARRSEFLVLALDADPANVAAAKRKAAEAGLLGRTVYVQQGSAESIPFADNYVDLLVLDVAEKDLSHAVRAEIMRVLTPIRGRAVLRDARIAKPELPGSDWWTHKLHGPDNNPVSRDTVFAFPPILQYRAMPLYNSSMGAALTVNGMHFEVNDWVFKKPTRANLCGRITARSLYNGQVIWQGMAPEDIIPTTPTFAATETELLMASGSRAEIVRMDQRTGGSLPGIVLGDETKRVKWLAYADGTIYALVGGRMEKKQAFSLYVPPNMAQWSEHQLFGTEIVAWDKANERVKWRHEEPVLIDYRNIALQGGRLYFYSEKTRLACLDASDGQLVWENAGGDWVDVLNRPDKPHNYFVANASSMIVADGAIRLAVAECKDWFLFSAKDGSLLHRITGGWGGGIPKSFILNGNLYQSQTGYSLQTGERLEESLPSQTGSAWCGLATYAPGTGVLGHSTLNYKAPCAVGAWVAGGILIYSPTICDCAAQAVPGTGAFASGGEILRRIEETPQHPLVRGPAYGRHGTLQDARPGDWAAYRGSNLHRGSSPASVGKSVGIAWQSTPATPFQYTTQYNQYVLDFDERPVPPVAVGEAAFTAGSDGVVAAHSLADGKMLWSFCADGPVFTSPACAADRLFVPCGDGWLYALDAETGELAWKRRLAPMDRRILMFGQLVSNWPVFSLMAADGVVYAAAGHFVTDGGRAFALDAETGEILWSSFSEPTIQGSHQCPDRPAQGYGGQTALVNDRVWDAGYCSTPLVLDRDTGQDHLAALKGKLTSHRGYYAYKHLFYTFGGQDVVVVDESIVLVGGNRILENQQMREGKRARVCYKMYQVDEDGDWGLDTPPLNVLHVARIAPACDGELLVFAGPPPVETRGGRTVAVGNAPRATLGLNVWRKDAFVRAGRAMQKQPFIDEEKTRGELTVFRNAFDDTVFGLLDHGAALWQKPELDVNAVALAGNAVIVAHADKAEDLFTWSPGQLSRREALMKYDGWKLSAFHRQTADQLWSVSLPAEPLFNGVAVSRDGSVIVTLRDGALLAVGE